METPENSVKQMLSDVKWDVEYCGHNFHVTMGFDCKDIYDIDILSEDKLNKEYSDEKKRNEFISKMIEFLRDKIWNDKSIWLDSL